MRNQKKNHSTKHHENHEITAKINVQELNINFLEITGFSYRWYDIIFQKDFYETVRKNSFFDKKTPIFLSWLRI